MKVGRASGEAVGVEAASDERDAAATLEAAEPAKKWRRDKGGKSDIVEAPGNSRSESESASRASDRSVWAEAASLGPGIECGNSVRQLKSSERMCYSAIVTR